MSQSKKDKFILMFDNKKYCGPLTKYFYTIFITVLYVEKKLNSFPIFLK